MARNRNLRLMAKGLKLGTGRQFMEGRNCFLVFASWFGRVKRTVGFAPFTCPFWDPVLSKLQNLCLLHAHSSTLIVAHHLWLNRLNSLVLQADFNWEKSPYHLSVSGSKLNAYVSSNSKLLPALLWRLWFPS